MAGLDMMVTEESLTDTTYPDEEDYSPMSDGDIALL
jgi:hypothetical protein